MTRTLVIAMLAAMACRDADRPRVAFLLSTLQDERYAKDVAYFEHRAAQLGLRTVTMAAGNDDAKQLAQVEDMLARGVKVLVVQPTSSRGAASYVRLAHEHGAKIVAYDRAIVSPDLDYFVSHDSYRVGVLQAEAALKATGGKGKFVLLAGQEGHSVAAEITRGCENTLAPYVARGDVEIVMKQFHAAWSQDEALHSVEQAIARTGGKIDAILANNSSLARGAVEAVTVAGLRHVFIAGADADAANVNYVCQGKQAIEVFKGVQPLAEAAADVAQKLLDDQPVDGERELLVRVDVITPDNVKALLVDTGYLTAEELPACKTQLAEAR